MIPRVPDGLIVRYEHCRHYTGVNHVYKTAITYPDPKGGTTICRLIRQYVGADDEVVAVGEAQCSDEDQYVKKIGRDISLGRALKELNAD